jgi:hypothetical protein
MMCIGSFRTLKAHGRCRLTTPRTLCTNALRLMKPAEPGKRKSENGADKGYDQDSQHPTAYDATACLDWAELLIH